MSEKLGTEKIESILDSVKEIVIVGKKVKSDGKVDASDLVHFLPLIQKLPQIVENFKDVGEAFKEGKDIDVAEVVSLIQKIHEKVKEIENA